MSGSKIFLFGSDGKSLGTAVPSRIGKEKNDLMKTKVSLPIIVVAVLFLVVAVGLIAYASFRPRSGPKFTVSADQQANNAWLTQKAKECDGIFDKLALPDQQKAQELT